MPLLLHLETATQVCSVVLSDSGKVLSLRESNEKNIHSSVITVFIQEVLEETGKNAADLDAICISQGPGSYTGLRIGVSTAKGLCYALDKPLIAINTLQSMAFGKIKALENKDIQKRDDILLCPMIDARRMEVYTAIYDIEGNTIRDTKAEIIDKNSFMDLLKGKQIWFFGNGAEKCRDILGQNPSAHFDTLIQPSAANMIIPAEIKYGAGEFEDVAYFEPFYLKDFLAGVPRVKGLYD